MAKVISSKDFDRMCHDNNLEPLAYFSGTHTSTGRPIRYKFRCLSCDTIFSSIIYDDHPKVCPTCKKYEFRSQRERQLYNYLTDLGYSVQCSNRTVLEGFEIDLYIPSHKVGFELNGIVYHSHSCNIGSLSSPKPPDYHLSKTLFALSKGVRLFHLWDYESLESIKLFMLEVLQGQLPLTSWVDKNPYLSTTAELRPLYYISKDTPPYRKGLSVERPRIWDSTKTPIYEFYNAGFNKNK